MKVGINPAIELKEESQKQNRPFSDILHQYVEENLIERISESQYREDIWIKDSLPWENSSEKIRLYYRNKADSILESDFIEQIVEKIMQEKDEVKWSYNLRKEDDEFVIGFVAEYKGMKVPITVIIEAMKDISAVPEKKNFRLMLRPVKQINCLVYSPETEIVDYLYEIIEKLELIGDMESYAVINNVLKSSSVSGRHIIEGLSEKTANSPKVLKEKRISQIESYKKYTYMKKRWDKYCKTHSTFQDNWEDVVERVVKFSGPIWQALCRNEIFFDDWMPELGRFLG